jgi:hypothetical protein
MKAIILATVLAAGACMPPPGGGYGLTDAVRTYTEGVKWERFEAAAAVVPPRERNDFLDERDLLAKDLRITQTEILRVTERGNRAEVHVKMTWYLDSEGTVHESVAAQRWERQGKAWRLIDERRARGHEMPGLREAPEARTADAD